MPDVSLYQAGNDEKRSIGNINFASCKDAKAITTTEHSPAKPKR